MKIAIIGSGISGLTTAYLLNRQHDIQVFEASDWIGGHTHTVDVQVDVRSYAIDTGFIVFNDWTYPNFMRLLSQLQVAYQPTEMSFSVRDQQSGVEYNGNTLNSLFAQRRNLLSPLFWGMLRDILRFNREAIDDLQQQRIDAATTLGSYLQTRGYRQRFIDHYIVPMGAAIWSMSLGEMLNFPLQFFVRFFKNHGLLSVTNRPQWHVVSGGSRSYVEPLCASFRQHIRLNCPVHQVERDALGVTVHSAQGSERFDKVVFACHSDQALRLLAKPSQAEQSILGALPYADNEVVLHTDTRLLPKRRLAWASWNYHLEGQLDGDRSRAAAVTYNMNILQGIHSDTTFCVSLNQNEAIDPATVLSRHTYAHPQYSLAGVAAQARWHELVGAQHSYYCGAYWANGFHEDGVVSALRVANAFGEAL
ncbi:NAD(P)/FAD-dependent oxidoreductase [Pseudomonas sp. GV071]|uniref:NAD(P)/FAD-dependent oxidoreductase n=1 Tax=Pseudomonas sp. GV071 TaxID=2135754 RepID=UPI000D3C063A|nr:FAD-dependent oxidoreductase [Pseudomonas sp. GV071]PTQ67723.1 putative NAD/FAD-binding protein [Pseudomonas sp. GV071]